MTRSRKAGFTSAVKRRTTTSSSRKLFSATYGRKEKNFVKNIQWFPGHMAKAMRMMEENVKLCDAVIFVLDARCPASSFNAKLLSLTGSKPVLFVLNKSDLADPAKTDMTLTRMKESGRQVVKCTATYSQTMRALKAAMTELVKDKIARLKEKGVKKPLRFMVAGIPNTGKSTVINLLAGERKAQAGDKAGVTRAKQWVKCGEFELLDTPGTMPPACENQMLARRLAYVGGINDDILEMDEIALALLEEMKISYPMSLSERYGIEGNLTALEMLDCVCKKRGLLLRRGEYDYERGERALIDDLRKGKLGKVTFDSEDDLKEVGLI